MYTSPLFRFYLICSIARCFYKPGFNGRPKEIIRYAVTMPNSRLQAFHRIRKLINRSRKKKNHGRARTPINKQLLRRDLAFRCWKLKLDLLMRTRPGRKLSSRRTVCKCQRFSVHDVKYPPMNIVFYYCYCYYLLKYCFTNSAATTISCRVEFFFVL